jgi:hypothetical protein
MEGSSKAIEMIKFAGIKFELKEETTGELLLKSPKTLGAKLALKLAEKLQRWNKIAKIIATIDKEKNIHKIRSDLFKLENCKETSQKSLNEIGAIEVIKIFRLKKCDRKVFIEFLKKDAIEDELEKDQSAKILDAKLTLKVIKILKKHGASKSDFKGCIEDLKRAIVEQNIGDDQLEDFLSRKNGKKQILKIVFKQYHLDSKLEGAMQGKLKRNLEDRWRINPSAFKCKGDDRCIGMFSGNLEDILTYDLAKKEVVTRDMVESTLIHDKTKFIEKNRDDPRLYVEIYNLLQYEKEDALNLIFQSFCNFENPIYRDVVDFMNKFYDRDRPEIFLENMRIVESKSVFLYAWLDDILGMAKDGGEYKSEEEVKRMTEEAFFKYDEYLKFMFEVRKYSKPLALQLFKKIPVGKCDGEMLKMIFEENEGLLSDVIKEFEANVNIEKFPIYKNMVELFLKEIQENKEIPEEDLPLIESLRNRKIFKSWYEKQSYEIKNLINSRVEISFTSF